MHGKRVALVKDNISFPEQPSRSQMMLKLIEEYGIQTMPVKKFQRIGLFKHFGKQPIEKLEDGKATINVLVLRVEFVEDDISYTTGNGKMDTIGLGSPDTSGLFYDPPHTKIYFERQMQFLSNYYKVNSFGNLEVNYVVKPDDEETGFQLPHQMAYYSGFDHYDEETGFVYYNWYALEMGLVRIFADGIAAADQDPSIDFSDYDAIVIFHAGAGLETSLSFMRFQDIWSASFGPSALAYYTGTPYILANNGSDTIDCPVAVNPEMERVDEYMVGVIGTVCHEFGHVLGLPDLYDVTGWSNGVGAWDLMGTGAWVGSSREGAPEGVIPGNLGAWSRYAMGWVMPKLVTESDTLLTVRTSTIDTTQYDADSLTILKIPISDKEFFLVENRQQDVRQKDTIYVDVEDGVVISVDYGEYDFFTPGSGILIWHIDDKVVSVWADSGYNLVQINPQHKGVDVEEADGIQHFDAWWYGDSLEYYGSAYDLFFVDDSGKANHFFGPFSNPNTDSYYGKSLISIDVKSAPDTMMNLSVSFDIYQNGFPVTVWRGHPVNSVSYGDLDNNGDLEIVVATHSGYVYAFNHDGTNYDYMIVDTLTSYITIGDVNRDGADDILFASGLQLRCIDGLTFTSLTNFPFHADNDILGAPLLFDLDNDNFDEIIFGSKDRQLYCLDSSATDKPHFPIQMNTELVSTPCVFDPDNRQIGVLGSNGTFWLIDENGIIKEFTESKHNMITFASPVVGDLDRDGEPEAVTINGYGTIYIYGADTLEEWFDILIDTTFYVTPALADVDADGYLEIIMQNSSKTLYVTNRTGVSENNFPLYAEGYLFYPMLVADLDDNGSNELIFGAQIVDSLGDGQLRIINNRNNEFSYSPLFGQGGFTSPGVIVDIDNDGDIEIASGTEDGMLYVWDFHGTGCSWSGYMNSPKNWGYFTGELTDPPAPARLINSFYIYPSPVETSGKVRFFLTDEAEVTLEIMDIVGHEIGKAVLTQTTAQEYNEVSFDFSKQSNGMYIVKIDAKSDTRREIQFKKFAVLK
jgi:M6 family metalloprotease-like protein